MMNMSCSSVIHVTVVGILTAWSHLWLLFPLVTGFAQDAIKLVLTCTLYALNALPFKQSETNDRPNAPADYAIHRLLYNLSFRLHLHLSGPMVDLIRLSLSVQSPPS